MNALPNMGVSHYAPKNSIITSQQQQQMQQFQQDPRHQGHMLPPIPHLLSTGSGGAGTPSFQLTSATISPAAIGKPVATVSSVVPGGECHSLAQQLVTPTSPVFGYAARNLPGQQQQPQSSPSQPQQQPPLQLLNIPIGHAYTYHPSTEHSQTTGLIFSNNPITPTQSSQHILTPLSVQTHTKPRPSRNKSKFKRFRNAFIYFVNDQRSRVDDETKRLKNREFLQLMSARWKGMSEVERSPYVKLAEDDKKRFNDDVKKFGKYESRQRRYNKSRQISRDILGQNNSYMAGAHQYPSTTAGLLYSTGFANMAAQPTQVDIAATTTAYPSFYVGPPVGPQGNAANAANWQQQGVGQGVTNDATSAMPVGMPQPPALSNAMLCPPDLLAQRTSLSSNGSSNELGELQQTSVGPRYPWMPADARTPGGQMEAGKYNPYYQQQQQSSVGTYMQVPLGAPISHSLTEPVFYGDNHAQPQISAAVQAQIRNSNALAHQQQQQTLQAQNYSVV
ncbi:hypothetical protein GGI19_004514 [Coemansia pectinata]|uniref:HMG box domain-containing protein n=1 Tax=Coemansia pectinata TaxID=1052879 RepID=A0A9W8L8C5_9FUNG|nr:hypothetical protein GGI19_004514 [Coemansia pectinata]